MKRKRAAYRIDTNSPEQTQQWGQKLGTLLTPGLVIGLVGQLGAGKTNFVKGIAAGNGLDDPRKVTSPTFSLVHEYAGSLPIRHVDAYRLGGCDELEAIGFEEFSRLDAVTLVEWADLVVECMPEDCLWLYFDVLGERARAIDVAPTGESARRLANAWHAG